jgi:hypothetical protein
MFVNERSSSSSSRYGESLKRKGMLKGSSIMFPTSSIHNKAQQMAATQGIILQPNGTTKTSGREKDQTLRNRLVCLE